TLLLGLGATPAAFHVGGALLGLGVGTLQIITLTRIARVGAQLGQGRTAGVSSLSSPAGGLFGSLLGGLAGQFLGLQPIFLLFALIFIALFGAAMLQSRHTSSKTLL
ncbi:MAG TPA: hypothetical protein VGC24_04550, partial [Burkholderiaceae bacterium]